jgi:hypothetical protein
MIESSLIVGAVLLVVAYYAILMCAIASLTYLAICLLSMKTPTKAELWFAIKYAIALKIAFYTFDQSLGRYFF